LLNEPLSAIEAESRKLANIERIRNSYSHAQIISQYESLMLEAVLKRS
jgi:hypothetical protein